MHTYFGNASTVSPVGFTLRICMTIQVQTEWHYFENARSMPLDVHLFFFGWGGAGISIEKKHINIYIYTYIYIYVLYYIFILRRLISYIFKIRDTHHISATSVGGEGSDFVSTSPTSRLRKFSRNEFRTWNQRSTFNGGQGCGWLVGGWLGSYLSIRKSTRYRNASLSKYWG